MNRLLLISPDQGSGFKPIISGKNLPGASQRVQIYS